MRLNYSKQPTTTLLMGIPSGEAGVKATLVLMSKLTKQFKKDITIRELAVRLSSRLKQKDWRGEIANLFEFVKNEIRYIKDIANVETIHYPTQTLIVKSGDCDDKSLLLASLLESIGYKTRFVAVGFIPNSYSHVFVQVKINTGWLSLETTEPVKIGWTPPNIKSQMVVHN